MIRWHSHKIEGNKHGLKTGRLQQIALNIYSMSPAISPLTRMGASTILDSKGLTARTGTRRMGRTAALQFQLLQCPELPS
jgi:hypothetical protein